MKISAYLAHMRSRGRDSRQTKSKYIGTTQVFRSLPIHKIQKKKYKSLQYGTILGLWKDSDFVPTIIFWHNHLMITVGGASIFLNTLFILQRNNHYFVADASSSRSRTTIALYRSPALVRTILPSF